MNQRPITLFISGLVFLLLTAFAFNRFLAWHEYRPGIVFQDPFFSLFSSIDCSWPTFLMLYSGVLSFLFVNRTDLKALARLAFAYAIILLLRMFSLWILPFYADNDAIKLDDPFLNTFIYPNNYVARDLFFSGHVAILVLLVLFTAEKKWRRFYTLLSVGVGVTVVLQKVHFSIDVIAAPFFALLAYGITVRFIIRR